MTDRFELSVICALNNVKRAILSAKLPERAGTEDFENIFACFLGIIVIWKKRL